MTDMVRCSVEGDDAADGGLHSGALGHDGQVGVAGDLDVPGGHSLTRLGQAAQGDRVPLCSHRSSTGVPQRSRRRRHGLGGMPAEHEEHSLKTTALADVMKRAPEPGLSTPDSPGTLCRVS